MVIFVLHGGQVHRMMNKNRSHSLGLIVADGLYIHDHFWTCR